ncbi:MAG TPA: fused MFS/spermidine synthase [Steroidobacteraceae bacterium]|jgi:predicted membrane-bound spermidine synthase|nr:fused MFS/spermidine synthase [Steroidobacteraceae bacterium]
MPNIDSARRRFLLGVFVMSGFTGLIYESIWSHYLKLFLGHAAYAQTLVLSIFMGGMALGAWLISRYSSRLRQLLWGYLLVEGLIGVLGLLFHRVFVAATEASFATVIPALPAGFAIDLYKWSLGSLLLVPQSVLLGMTFPLISGGIIRRWPARPGETLAVLYFANSLGAAVGVLVGGFLLIALVGLPGTMLTAGLLNVALALAVWLLIRGQPEALPIPLLAPESSSARATDQAAARWFLLAAFVTGLASFLYELGWIRMLSLVLGSSTHSFELMLSAFIFGLAFGGLYVRRRIESIANPESYLAAIMLTMGALAALTVPTCNLMYDFMAWALGTFTHTSSGYVAFNAVSQFIAMLIMFPATFCAGMTLPLLTHALMRRGAGERAIGAIYSVNTLGAIAGVLLAVHLLMPWVGLKGVILTGSALHVALGLSRLGPGNWLRAATSPVVASSVAVLALTAIFGGLDPMRVASGVFRVGIATLPTDAKVIFARDGKTATVTVHELGGIVAISTNGKPDAGLQMEAAAQHAPDETTGVLAAAIPLSMRPDATRVANIGFGSGLTTHTLLASPRLRHLDTIEIEPVMVEGARRAFMPRIKDVFEDPRSHIIYEDAKTFFAASPEPYDLIVSEPSNPWVSGVANLFSDEFYGRLVQYLRPDGCLVQWVQIYETDIRVVASIIKALKRHFGAYAIYNLNDLDILIVATRAAAFPAASEQFLHWPQMHAELDRVGVQSLADLRSRLIGDDRIVGPMFDGLPVPVNSDFFPFVDLNAPRLRFMASNAFSLTGLTSLPVPVLDILRADAPSGPTLDPSQHSTVARDVLVRRALAIRRAVSSGRLDDLDTVGAVTMLLLRTSTAQCADPQVQDTWKTGVRNVGAMTATYLSIAELADLWSNIRSTPCYRDVDGPHKAWADLLAAVAARNAKEIASGAAQLMAASPAPSPEERTYLTSALASAYLRLGQTRQADELLARQWDQLDHRGEFGLSLNELRALAQVSDNRTLADGRAAGSDPPGS